MNTARKTAAAHAEGAQLLRHALLQLGRRRLARARQLPRHVPRVASARQRLQSQRRRSSAPVSSMRVSSASDLRKPIEQRVGLAIVLALQAAEQCQTFLDLLQPLRVVADALARAPQLQADLFDLGGGLPQQIGALAERRVDARRPP